jgi:anti-sigma factor RsiW
MTCAESEVLLHALLDGELDAGHAREVETHLETCPRCARQLVAYRELQQAMPAAQLRFTAPMSLRRRIETALPAARPRTSSRLLCGSMPTKSRMRSVGIEPLAGPSAAAGLSVICETCPNDPANGGIAIGH